ncbi:MAG: PAS domain S-box protein [Rhodohalobacter sp.]|uniref:PAS domain-containing sensor histidine kinase n=1 Tax=Rhodohalobacter sp. TaxID=1974210 RepID=UPI003975D6A8
MMIENDIDVDILSNETGLKTLKDRMMPILKSAADICEATTALIYFHMDSDPGILASHGACDELIVSAAKKISDVVDPDNGLSIIHNVRDHQQAASLLSDLEMDKIQFFAGATFRSEAGDNMATFCICDSMPRDLSDDQKQQLQVMIDGARAHLMFYKKTELLKESSKKLKSYSALLQNSADLTFLLEPGSGKITDVSNGVEKVLGYSPDTLKGKPFTNFLEADELEDSTIEQWFSSEKQHRGRYSTSVRLIDKHDRKRWFQCNFSGDENKWYVTAIDISDKKEAEQGVYELKDKLKKIVSVATDLIYELDWASGDLSWGDELTDVLGYPNSEKFVDYDWWLDKIHPDDLEQVVHDVELTMEGDNQKSNLVYRIRTFDGLYKYVMNRIYVDRNEDGTPDTIIGAIVDVSELVEIEEKAFRNKKLLEELADNAWSATWIRDANGTFVFANDKFRSLLGLSGKKVVDKNLYDLFDSEKASQFKANDQKVLESGEPIVFEEQLRVNGKVRYYKTNIFPIKGVPGLKQIVGGVAIDITEEKESRDLLEDSLEEKNILLAEIHHRVKNNLAVVSGMMELQAYSETDERVQEKLYDSTGRIKTMATIHELLYRASSFKNLRLDRNIEQLITNITDTYHSSIDLELSYDMESVELNINDAIPCSLILNEIVTNILKHAYDDGDSGTMHISLIEEDGTVTLKIRDDGKGLPDDLDEEDSGTSLGMELIQTLTSQLHGSYSYTSLDEGVEFKLIFDKTEGKGSSSNFK